jgi:hypothetical protein
MKIFLLAVLALAVVTAANLSPAMANRFGPFDTRLTDYSDMLGQNGVNAATTTPDGGHYVNTTTDVMENGRDIGCPSH